MGRSPSHNDNGLKKGPWTAEEDEMLIDYISRHGHGSWSTLPKLAGLNRCGKSCRLRWTNYLRPDIKRGNFSEEEEQIIIHLHSILGNKWSRIAGHLPGRTDNEIKNFWNTHLRKKLLQMGIDPNTHMPRTDLNHLANLSQLLCSTNLGNLMNPLDNAHRLQADAAQLAKLQLLQNLLQVINTSSVLSNIPNIKNTSLLGTTQNLNPFETYLSNGSVPPATPQEFLNLGSLPLQAPSENQAFAGSWACNEVELIQEFLNIHDDSMKYSYGNQTVSSLPALVSASTETSTVNDEMESKSNPNYVSDHSPTSTIFEAWEKLMDDESSGSYWKEILD